MATTDSPPETPESQQRSQQGQDVDETLEPEQLPTRIGGAFVPVKPMMGGLEEQQEDSWVAWMGGKPKANWTGLVDPDPDTINPPQFRPIAIESST